MLHIIVSSLILSIIHASIPNHWLPLVAIGRAEKWSKGTTLWATAISGFAHIASTIVIGIGVGWAGYQLSSSYHVISALVAPAVLVAFGVFYVVRHFMHRGSHLHFDKVKKNASFGAIVFSLSVSMFFSPCVELESYYFTAGALGWAGILGVSLVYLVVTVSAMVIYVALAIEGINRFNFTFLERNEKLIVGIVLIVMGMIAYLLNQH